MSARQFFVLGTSSQVPTRRRNHNGYFLEWDGQGFLFDPGEGTQRQMIFSGVAASRIHHILITHFHGDHCLGLAGIIQRLSLDRITRPVHIYYPASGQQFLNNLRRASHFHDVTQLVLHPIHKAGVLFEDALLCIETTELDHTVESWGYRIREKDSVRMLPGKLAALGVKGRDIGKLKEQGFLDQAEGRITLDQACVAKPGQVMAFVMDTRDCAGARALAQGADLLVCESTYLLSEQQDASNNGHLTADQAGEIAAAGGARLLVLTHFSQRYTSTAPFVLEAQRHHQQVVAVSDGDVVAVPVKLG